MYLLGVVAQVTRSICSLFPPFLRQLVSEESFLLPLSKLEPRSGIEVYGSVELTKSYVPIQSVLRLMSLRVYRLVLLQYQASRDSSTILMQHSHSPLTAID